MSALAAGPRSTSSSTGAPAGSGSTRPVAVIGAGPGGLAAAILLAASGIKVRVYESQPVIGGRTSRITLTGSDNRHYHFDRGPTFFLMPYVLEEIFAAAGRRLTDYATLSRLDPMYRLLLGRPGADPIPLDATQDVPEMARRIAAISPPDGPAFERFIADNRTKLRLMTPILRRPIRGLMDLISLDTMRVGPWLKPTQSVHDQLARYFQDHHVRLAVSFQSKYLGMSPYECPSLFTILPFIEYEYGIWHPTGGCNALMAAMADVARELGVEILTDAPVQKLEFSGSKLTAVGIGGSGPLAGTLQRHDDVVINADATWALKSLIPERLRAASGWADADIDRKRYSCSTYMLYLGLDGPTNLPHHTIYISSRYKQNLDEISVLGSLSEDPSLYVCNPCPVDPSLAPPGQSALYVLMPTPNCSSGIDWAANRELLRARAIEQMQTRMGIPDVAKRIRAEMVITPDDWRAANINFGATFNLAHNLGQMLHKRPQHKLQGADGVWLVGGGTHPGSGLPVIFLSSQITSRLLCEHIGATYAG